MTNLENLRKALEVLQTLASLDMTAVPIEPSQAMIEAGAKESNLDADMIKRTYAAMLLASDDAMPF